MGAQGVATTGVSPTNIAKQVLYCLNALNVPLYTPKKLNARVLLTVEQAAW
jgi:hypothetical protein